jgi:hypothetical protein
MRRPGKQLAADFRWHQPGVQMTTRQTRDLSDGFRRRRARPSAEVLHSPAPPSQTRQHRQAGHRGFSIPGGCRQSQARKLVHDRSQARPVGLLVRSVPMMHPFTTSLGADSNRRHGKRSNPMSVMALLGATPPKPRIGAMRSMQSQAEQFNGYREVWPAGKLVFQRLSRCNLLVPIIEPGAARSRVNHVRKHHPAQSFSTRSFSPCCIVRLELLYAPRRAAMERDRPMTGMEPAQCDQ